ncbi:peptidoglycan recognition protein-like [Macrosteles quadrilineatus]|uniref:peptidoglycan recognition protein-like n=1 Tax=Macrosteles quadrilineatus TaxID=74068 RepID=UPI0023E3108B|nr:peptidoglycan recognition protein-like [Macrosteles quadrilineatus]
MADHMFAKNPSFEFNEPRTRCIPDPEDDNLYIFKTPLEIVPRSEWGAADPYTLDLSTHPLPHIFMLLMYTRTGVCRGDNYCARILREVQQEHMLKRNLPDIQWNFMIGGNGKVYEGRGWKYSATKDSENMSWDWKSFDVAYICSKEEDVTKQMKNAASKLVRLGIQLNMLVRDFVVLDDMIFRPEDYPKPEGKNMKLYTRL